MNYVCHILVMFAIFAVLGLSLNVVVGLSGRLCLCHGAFYGLGAFISSLLAIRAGWGFLGSTIASAASVGVIAFLLGLPTLRLRGDFFVLATIGFQVIVFSILYNWIAVTGGPDGLSAIPPPVLFGCRIETPPRFLLVAVVVLLIVLALSWQLARSPFGRALRAVRDDQVAATALGMNPLMTQASGLAVSGALAALAGSLWATWASYINPTDFGLDTAVSLLALVVIGGSGNTAGPVAGAGFMVLVPEIIRIVGIPGTSAAAVRQMIFGILLILIMRFRRQGFMGDYTYD